MSVVNQVLVDQTVHGYSGGHRLLQSSKPLSHDAQRALLLLSDMSGPSMVPGFEEYLTGYPLPGGGLFAFAKTWYAPEMERPGCVWTHTLLISHSDLARLPDLAILETLFERPQKSVSGASTIAPLPLNLNEVLQRRDRSLTRQRLVKEIVHALYGQPTNPVFLIADKVGEAKRLVLDIWSQQWPRLRRTFQFSTGSLSNRHSDGKQFDLQIVPTNVARQIERDLPHAQFVHVGAPDLSEGCPSWVETACDEVSGRAGANLLREFLWSLGAATDAGRGAFQTIVRVFEILARTKPQSDLINELLDTVAQYSPNPIDAQTLTTALFSDIAKWPRPRLPESKLLWEIGTNTRDDLLDPVGLEVRRRSQSLWRTGREAATNLLRDLVDAHPNPVGEEVIDAICEVLGVDDAIRLAHNRAGLLPVLLSRNPKLAAFPEVWRSASPRREMFDAVARVKNISNELVLEIVRAIITAGADDVAEDAFKRLGTNPSLKVLEIFDSTCQLKPSMIGHSWRRLLARNSNIIVKWLGESSSPRLETVALIASVLDPRASEVRRLNAGFWLRYSYEETSSLDDVSLVNMMAFLLARAFDDAGVGADKLTALSFQTVYDAAASDRLGFEAWRLLQDLVPSLGWWREWDKCERLIHGLIDRFSRLTWSPEEFLHSARSETAFSQAVEVAGRDYFGRQYLKRIAEEVRRGVLPATDLQRRLLYTL